MLPSGASCFFEILKRPLIFFFSTLFLVRAKSSRLTREFKINILLANCAFVMTFNSTKTPFCLGVQARGLLVFSLAFIHHQNTAFALHLKMPCSVDSNNKMRLLSPNYSKTRQLYDFSLPACASSLWSEAKKRNNKK